MTHQEYMLLALEEAKKAAQAGETPVGCLIVGTEGRILAKSHNLTEAIKDATAHAELLAIREAQKALNDRRLLGCTLYVTLEPCPMCSGAIILSRPDLVVFGARDWERGGLLSNANLANTFKGYRPKVIEGICSSECEALLKDFFQSAR